MIDLKIFGMTYENNYTINAPVLNLHCRDREWKRHMITICDKKRLAPEFYILKEEKYKTGEFTNIINSISLGPLSNYEEETLRVTTTFPFEVKNLRKHFERTFLADVKWIKRCMQEMQLKHPYIRVPDDYMWDFLKVKDVKELPKNEHFEVPIRYIAWDIETDCSKTYPEFNGWQDYKDWPMISVSALDSYDEEYHRFFWKDGVDNFEKFIKKWERRGFYYVPALKKKKLYDNINDVIDHGYSSEQEMMKGYFNWFASKKPDADIGFNSEGGYRIVTKNGYSKKYWFDGFDMPFMFKRAEHLGLKDDIQIMSPLKNGVRFRNHGGRASVTVEGVCQVDMLYANEIWKYHEKFTDFRGGKLDDYMAYFLGFGKIKHEEQIWEMWKNSTKTDYDPSNPELSGVSKRRNYIKELWNESICL